jgi:Mg-chelatase subunit ChlD
MSFLTPLFLLGGLAVTLPIVFHLVRRASREKLVFSSLMFLKPAPPRMTRRNRLEHVFLLLLRCLAICLLAFGFARPFMQKPMAATPQTASSSRIVLVVDTSASMKREGVWPAAVAKAEAALKDATPADQVAVLTFDDQVRSVVSFEQWAAMGISERGSISAQRLAANQPTWRSTHLGNALIAAAEALEDADKREQQAGPKRIVLITDLQEGSRLDGMQGYEWPRGTEVIVETVKAKRPTNAGLQWVMDAEDSAPVSAEVTTRIRVSNSSDARSEQFQIRWDGVADAATLDAYVPPGQSRIVPAPRLPTNAVGERITLNGDDDAFDNVVYLVQPKAEEINVLFLGDDSGNDPAKLLYYLKRAFQDTRRQAVRISSLASGGALASSGFTTNRLLIVSSVLPENRLAEVRKFTTEGGTVLCVMNDAVLAKTLGQLTDIPDLGATEAEPANYAMFGQMDFEHPLLAPFSDPRFSDFTKIRFWKHRKLPLDKLPDARVVARFDNNDPAILEIPAGRGRLFVFAFSWQPADSQLALSSKFVPLLYSILEQAGGIKAQLAQYRVGDTVDLSALVAKSGGAVLSVRKPEGAPVQLASGETRFSDTETPGIYEVIGPESLARFAVNLDSAESKTAPLAVDDLERLGLPMKPLEIELSKVVEQRQTMHNTELESRQKLWRWLIVAALVVLMGETWLAGWITRRTAAPVEATV